MWFQIRRHACTKTTLLAGALALLAAGCGAEVATDPVPDGAGPKLECAASEQSGLWLLPFGPLTQEVNTGGQATISVVVTQGSETQGEGKGASGKDVSFRIITLSGDAKLSAKQAQTDTDGLAEVKLTAGQVAQLYQVEASVQGTCATTFTVDVKKPLRQLRAVTPSPVDTFTGARIPLAVEATTDGNARLKNEPITFKVGQGQTSETLLADAGAQGGGSGAATLKVNTNDVGRATVMLATGSQAIAQLVVVASMQGTADAEIRVRIRSTGTQTGCTSDADCPLDYTCKAGKCEKTPVTPPSGCTKDADCTPPNTCQIATGQCVAPTPTGGCKTDNDCTPPNICNVSTGKCMQPTGSGCDPIEGTGCKPDEICVAGQCATLPKSGCTDHSQCPTGFKCDNGKCVPQGKPPTGGCVTNSDCPSGQACVNGVCKAKQLCNIPGKTKDRLKGTWKYDSTLHLRQALSGFMSGFLSAAGALSSIINGSFSISGVPSFISDIVKKYLKKLVNQYVPPWGQQLITTLGNINDIVDDMRVRSTVHKTSSGNDKYVCSEQWDLVEFDYQGKKISSPPSAIPQIGQVKVSGYTATEVCGVLFIQKHKLKNVVGGIVKWAINTALSLVTCNVQGVPCYNSVDQALQQAINCPMLAMQLDQMVQSIWSGAPSVASIVAQACQSQKQDVIKKINDALNKLTTSLSLLELSGTVTIPSPGQDNKLSGGKWNGILGSGIAKGNFNGEFSATKGP